MGYIVLEILNVWEEQRKHATRVRWKFPEVDREALVCERVKILTEENLRLAKKRKERQERVVQEMPVAPQPPPAPNWADVARGKGKVEEKKAPPTEQPLVSKTPIKEKQPLVAAAVVQLPIGKLNTKEKQLPTAAAQVLTVKTPMAAPQNQPDSTFKAQRQAESTTPQKQAPGPQPVEAPKARGSGLLYTDILKKNALKQNQPKSQPSPAQAQAPPAIDTAEATDTDGDDAVVWQKYKSKKEKKADLHEGNDHQERDTVKTRTPAHTPAPTMPSKGKKKAETAPKSTQITSLCLPPKAPPLQLKLDVMTQEQEAKQEAAQEAKEGAIEEAIEEAIEVRAPPLALQPQIPIALPEQPNSPTLRDLGVLVDQEIEVEKQKLRRWLYRLQTWLWTFNEGVGLNFIEITDTPNWDTGFLDAVSSTHGVDGGQTEYASSGTCVTGGGSLGGSQNGMGQPRRVHRGGSKNKHTLWKMEVREREMRERAREVGVWDTERGHSQPQPNPGAWMSGALIDEGRRRGGSWGLRYRAEERELVG